MSQSSQQKLFLVFFSLTFFALSFPYSYTGLGVDASWSQALAMTVEAGKTFGKDFIFNYGPLGYFNTGLIPKNSSVWVSVSFQVFLLFNYLLLFQYAFSRNAQNWKKVALLVFLVFVPWGFFADTTFTLFYFFLFHLLYAQHNGRLFSLLLASLIALLIFYIKVNLSLIVLLVFGSSLCYFGLKKVFSWQKLIFIVLFLLTLIVTFSKVLHVDIPAYLGASVQIIDAYQDGMSDIQTTKIEMLALLPFLGGILLLAVLSFALNVKVIVKTHQLLFLYILLGLTLFLSIKQQFSTILSLNTFGFFLFMPPLFGLLYLFGGQNLKLKPNFLVIGVFLLSLGGTQCLRFFYAKGNFNGFVMTYLSPNFFQISSKVPEINDLSDYFKKRNPLNYFRGVADYSYENNYSPEFVSARKLPDEVRKAIGKSSVDIFPSEISYIYYNRLNYENRPIMQTYQANNAFLAQKNGEKYRSNSAPDVVLYKQEGFRGRYFFWEDTQVLQALMERYQIADTFQVQTDSLLLFKKRKQAEPLSWSKPQDMNANLGEAIVLDTTQLQYLQLDIKYSLVGKLMRLALQPPYLYCTMTYADGTQERYRASPAILKSGFIANVKVRNLDEASTFFNTKGKGNQKIRSLTFDSPLPFGFTTKIDGKSQKLD